MQNTFEANNKFEKLLLPIFKKLSIDNRIISNYRLFLNKEITSENICEITKKIDQHSEMLLELIAYNLHKNEQNPEKICEFFNRRLIQNKDLDMKKIELLFPKHYEIMSKISKNICSQNEELNELNELENLIFSYIRLGNDYKSKNNKKCVTKNVSNNMNSFINNSNDYNNNISKSLSVNLQDSKANTNNINNTTLITNGQNSFMLPGVNKNYASTLESQKNFSTSNTNFEFSNLNYYSIAKNESCTYNSIKNAYTSNSEFQENLLTIPNVSKFQASNCENEKNEKIKSEVKNTKPNKSIFFEVIQGKNSTLEIESISFKTKLSNEFNMDKNSETKENNEVSKQKKKLNRKRAQTTNLLIEENSNSIFSEENKQQISNFNNDEYFKLKNEHYHKAACDIESFLINENLENNSNANTNYCSNINIFVDQSKTHFPFTKNFNPEVLNENIDDYLMFIENQKEMDFFTPFGDIFKKQKQDINHTNNNNCLEAGIIENGTLKESKNSNNISENKRKSNKLHNSFSPMESTNILYISRQDSPNNLINKTSEVINNFASIDIFFENNKRNNSDSTGGDLDRDLNSIDDFSHISSDIDNLKKDKNTKEHSIKNKLIVQQIMKDPHSNYNYYSRQYIPKANKKAEKFKNMIPFLRDFNPKFLKKENIDKKILRKFRNFVKSFLENDLSGKIYSRISSKNDLQKSILIEYEKYKDLIFLRKFYKQNLLPPMSYSNDTNNITIEFKSFNTNYMLWLFSQEGISEVYKLFTDNLGNEILSDFIDSYNLEQVNKKSEIGIIQTLSDYIFSIEKIYTSKQMKDELKGKPEINLEANIVKNTNIVNEYSLLNANLLPKTLTNVKIPLEQKKMELDYEIVYQNNRCRKMTSEDIFDKCIDDLEIKNQAMILDFYNNKKDDKIKQNLRLQEKNRIAINNFKNWNLEINEEMFNPNTGKKLLGKIINEDQINLEGFNNQQLENLNFFY